MRHFATVNFIKTDYCSKGSGSSKKKIVFLQDKPNYVQLKTTGLDTSTLANDIRAFSATFTHYHGLQGKHILITGATGLIGSILAKCLLDLNERHRLGMHLTCPVRNREKAGRVFGTNDGNIDFPVIALERIDGLHTAAPVDYVVHLAAPTASKYFIEKPVETFNAVAGITGTLLDAALKWKVKNFVYVSSLEVYGSILDDTTAVTEEMQGYINPIDTRSSYPMGKRAAECLCHCYSREYGLRTSIARLAQTFGAGVSADDNRVFAQFARSAVNHRDIILHTTGELSRAYCYTTDAVAALLYIMLSGQAGEAYNVANPDTYISVKDMAHFIQKNFAGDIAVETVPQEGCGYSPTTKLRLDISKTEQLGWQPQLDLKEMFRRLIAHLTENRQTT